MRTTTTRRPARQFDVVRILATKADGSETCSVPQRYTLAEVQACVDNREESGTVQIRCAVCRESVHDCHELSGLLTGVPESWGWEWQVRRAYES